MANPGFQEPQIDLKVRACIDFANANWTLPRSPKTPELVAVSDAMKGNTARIRLLMLMPAQIGDMAIRMQRLLDLAEFEITGKVNIAGPPRDSTAINERWK